MSASGQLLGRRILVTRPAGQGEPLVRRLEHAGAAVLHRPTLRIAAVTPERVEGPTPPDWVVFTSPNAVAFGVDQLSAAIRSQARIAAVGPGTAAAAAQQGLPVDAAPSVGGGADALLDTPAFDVGAAAHVLIIRGEGGRRRLVSGLEGRGARVREAAVYRRMPAADRLSIPEEWQALPLDCTIVTSGSGLSYLLGMVGPPALEWIMNSRLVTVSERIAAAATAAGFEAPAIATGADDAAITRAVCAALQRESDEQDRQGQAEGPRDDIARRPRG